MRHLKLFESFNKEDIHKICKKYNIHNYTINENGSIDVDGCVSLSGLKISVLPLKFNKVSRGFYCSENLLTSLEGSPENVGGDFDCSINKLTSLVGSPKNTGGDFNCSHNLLTSLKGCSENVGRNFYCSNNQLSTLEGMPKKINNLFCNSNQIVTFEGFPKQISGHFYCINNPIFNMWNLFNDYTKIELFNDMEIIVQNGTIVLERLNYFLEEIWKQPVGFVKGYKCI